MGWASGSDIAIDMAEAIKKHVPDAAVRLKLYRALLKTLSASDWDTQDEALGIDPIMDRLINKN
jgi:hypothetical protein